MSEKLCTLRTKGGGSAKYTETSLWTNSAPTSTFAAQDVNLSDNISSYAYIKVRFAYGIASGYTDIQSEVIYKTDKLSKTSNVANVVPSIGCISTTGNGYRFSRQFYKNGDNKIHFDAAFYVTGTSGNTSYTDNLIPLEILGLNM